MSHFNIGHHHAHKRKRSKTSKSNKTTPWKKFLDKIIYPVGLLGPLMIIPQIVKIYVEKDASSIALASWLLFLFPAIIWVTYGFSHKDKVIIVCNSAWVVAYVFVVVAAIIY